MKYKSWKTKLTWVCNFLLPCFLVEFVLLLGYIQSAKRSCPTPFLGSFNYSLNDGSTTFCGSTSVWDVCIDQTEIVVNYTLCPKQQFYSGRFFLIRFDFLYIKSAIPHVQQTNSNLSQVSRYHRFPFLS